MVGLSVPEVNEAECWSSGGLCGGEVKDGNFCSPGGDASDMGVVGYDICCTGLGLLRKSTSATTAARSTAAPPIAIPAMAPGLRAGLDVVVDDLLAVDVGSVLVEVVVGYVEDIVVGMKGVGVAVEEPCEYETPAAMPLAVRLT